jgi:inner membrane protein
MNKMVFLKMLIVSVLTGVILIALAAVYGILVSRESYREDAVRSISDSYAGSQQLIGPVFVQPYTRTADDISIGDKGERHVSSHKEDGSYLVFPSTLTIQGTVRPSERHHGLYKATVYEMESHLTGTIQVPASTVSGADYGTPYLALRVSDLRGIVGNPVLVASGKQATWQARSSSPLPPSPRPTASS